MRFFVFWPIFKIKIAIKTAEIGLKTAESVNEQNGYLDIWTIEVG